MAELLDWPEKDFIEAFEEVLRLGMAQTDFEAPLVFLPNAIKYNPPQAPNVITGWRATWEEVPECQLKENIRRVLEGFLNGMTEAFQEAFQRACPKYCPKQEQEQLPGIGSRKQEQDKASSLVVAPIFSMPKSERSKRGHDLEALPEWVPLEAWNGFVEMRKGKKAEVRGRAFDLIIKQLERFRASGEDISAILDQSTANGWKGLFSLKNAGVPNQEQGALKEIDHMTGTHKKADGSLGF